MANAERLQQTLEFIKNHPEKWNQNRWVACFAGWTLRLDNPSITVDACVLGTRCCEVLYEDERQLANYEIEERATELLDLSLDEAEALFQAGNTFEDLERIAGELAEHQAVTP